MTQPALTETVAFRLAPREREHLDAIATHQNNTVSRIVRKIVADYLLRRTSNEVTD